MLEFLLKNRSEGASTGAIDSAAAHGHLNVVQWLTANVPGLASTTSAMDGAACAGHLNVVEFLHEARGEGCTVEAMDLASKRGHLEVRRCFSFDTLFTPLREHIMLILCESHPSTVRYGFAVFGLTNVSGPP